MKVAYLVNQYPHVSHTFIRREIAAVEELSVPVERYSLRPPPADLVDPADRAEASKTHVVLARFWPLVSATMLAAIGQPAAFGRAIAAAWRLGRRARGRVLRHLAYLCEACFLVRKFRRSGVTHLHAHFATNPAAVARLCRALGGPTYSFTAHGSGEFDDSLSLDEKVRAASFAVAVSSFGRSQLFRRCHPDDWPRIHVVRCGLDAELLDTPPTPVPDVARLVCVGRLGPEKGQLILVEAAAEVRAKFPRLEVILAGDGPTRGVIERRISQLGLESVVRITGWQTNSQVRDLIRRSRALVVPSFDEGLPVVIMEAFVLGRPVVSSAIAGIPELVQHGVNGWLFPAGSAEALAHAMTEVLNTSAMALTEMGARGREAVRKQHDARQEAAHLLDLFRKAS